MNSVWALLEQSTPPPLSLNVQIMLTLVYIVQLNYYKSSYIH